MSSVGIVRARLAATGARMLLPALLLAAGCADREGPAEGRDEARVAAAAETGAALRLERGEGELSVTHLASGRDFRIFADERVEGSDEQGTFHRLLSSFGNYLSFSSEWYYEGGAHPSYGKTYSAVEVEAAVEEADLRELFDDETIRSALEAAPVAADVGAGGETLDALLAALADHYGCEADFGSFYSSFFVKRAANGRALVEIGLSHGCEAARGNFTVIELEMPHRPEVARLFGDLRIYTEQS